MLLQKPQFFITLFVIITLSFVFNQTSSCSCQSVYVCGFLIIKVFIVVVSRGQRLAFRLPFCLLYHDLRYTLILFQLFR